MNKKGVSTILIILIVIVIAAIIGIAVVYKKPSTKIVSSQYSLGSGDYNFSLVHDGLTRTYKVHAPSQYNKNKETPAVLNLHGGGGNAVNTEDSTQMDKTSDKYGFIVVYPQGNGKTILGKTLGYWNAGNCCGTAKIANTDDVGFINSMLDDLENRFNIDKKRIYATGISNGGIMAQTLACKLSSRIAAAAPIAASIQTDCKPERAVPMIFFHGSSDPCIPPEGGTCGACGLELVGKTGGLYPFSCSSVRDMISGWVARDKCSTSPKITFESGVVTCSTYSQCSDNAEVAYCEIEGGGHTWPGGKESIIQKYNEIVGVTTKDISANEEMWKFFQKHPMK